MAHHEVPKWVVDRKMVPWAVTLFVVGVLYAAWFVLVLIGEAAGWTDDPAAWAGMPTAGWAFIGIALYVVLVLFLLALLIRREVPGRVYRVAEDGRILEAEGTRHIRVTEPPERRSEHAEW